MTERDSTPQGTEEVVGSGQTGPTAPAADQPLDVDAVPEAEQEAVAPQAPAEVSADAEHPDTVLAAERLSDLQRLQAEYVNYKRRVDRDRAVVQELAVHSVLESLLPVLDDISASRQHGDLEGGPFASIADKLEGVLGKFGLQSYGAAGEAFDPSLHEALMHTSWPADGSLSADGDATTVVQVLQPGYRAGERILRAARVAVADPE